MNTCVGYDAENELCGHYETDHTDLGCRHCGCDGFWSADESAEQRAGDSAVSKTKLKPCPFCGGQAELIDAYDAADDYDNVGRPWNRVRCTVCGIATGRCLPSFQNLPITKWNRRDGRAMEQEGIQ